ncbi:beta-1,6-N-acetylglucosaminyltransferase [Mucilaginibacter sp. HMF5004]|uniref:beta-1,6-N-acetylglucosaminyltransferase n=1 Tax=Mucilaginibacter rivuli TaxID=2857527 RepID=UPI001C5FB58A|nr:beta-1,6-N-acetylglucosaminyltransferase [Mucilaginibacter rivuli]MBW4890929.1 beta-1,6-N-acetylglucosaminyltransferase [Mucilaginibacter rivuli]
MKIAHLILVHKNPKQLARLMDRLQHPDADIYVHLDAKTRFEPFEKLLQRPNVYAIKKRIKVYWGSYSIVEATLNGFREILDAKNNYAYINLLSGDDYPIKTVQDIHNYFAANTDKIFMEYLTEDSDWWKSVKSRVTQYHLTDYRFPGKYTIQSLINNFFPARQRPADLEFVGRSQWLTITEEAAKYVINFLVEHPKVVDFFRLSWGSDEVVIQTVLYNSHLKFKIVNNNLRYIDWSANDVSPKTLGMEDAGELLQSPALYARKFDLDQKPEVLNYLDEKLLNKF